MIRVVLVSAAVLGALWAVVHDFGTGSGSLEDRLLLAELNREDGAAYRQRHARESGVVVLPDGLQVEVLHLGEGPVAQPSDHVVVHYRGWHVDGRLFEDTRRLDIPGDVPVDKTIPGWQRVLTSVPGGSHVRIVLPPELAYGAAGSGAIGPEETLIFEIELQDVRAAPQSVPRDALQQPVPGLGPRAAISPITPG